MFKRNKKATGRTQSRRQATTATNGTFRRNTVVISRSQRELKEYQQSVSQRQHDRKKAVQRRRQRNRIIALVLFLLTAAGLWQMRVGEVGVQAAADIRLPDQDKVRYTQTLTELVTKHSIGRQYWLLDTAKVTEEAKRLHPEIVSLQYHSQLPASSNLEITLDFRTPLFVWKDAGRETQYVDGNGVLFAVNRRLVKTDDLVHIEDQSGVILDQGSSVLTSELIQFVGQLPKAVAPIFTVEGSTISQVIIPRSTREVQFRVGEKPYVVRFSSIRPLPDQVKELDILLTNLRGQGIEPTNHIDLRVPGKAFYK